MQALHISRPVQQPLHADANGDMLREGSTLTVVSRELQRLSGIVSEVAAIDDQRSIEVTNLRQEASSLAAEIARLRQAAEVLHESRPKGDVAVKAEDGSTPLSESRRRESACTFSHTVDVQNDEPKPLKENANGIAETILARPHHPARSSLTGVASNSSRMSLRSGSFGGKGTGRDDGSGSFKVMGKGSLLPASPKSSVETRVRQSASSYLSVSSDTAHQSSSSYFSVSSDTRKMTGGVEFAGGGPEFADSASPGDQSWSGNIKYGSVSENSPNDEGEDNEFLVPDFETVHVCAIWQEPPRSTGKKKPPRSDSNVSWKFRRRQEEKKQYQLFYQFMRLIMLHPGSRKRLTWDIMGFILLCYDMVVIPFQMGFDPGHNDFFTILQWLTLMYWSLDVPISFISGYQAGELIEMRLKQIAIHYFRTWFVFDFIVLSFDWTLTLTEADDSSETAGIFRLGRRLRFLRILRMLRLVKIQMMMRDFFEHVQSESTLIFSRIGQLVMSIVVANHLIACGWYKLGTVDGKTWVTSNKMAERNMGYRYWTSMHWSVTQFTPASMEVVPVNMGERIYTVCVVLLAMVAFSSLVSGITNGMTQLRNLNKQRLMEYAVLRRYLAENRISTDLMSNIWGFLDHVRRRRTERTREHEVALLSILPKSLRTELQQEVYWPIVGVHPFFFHFGEVHQWAIRKMYQCALQELSLVVGQEVFTAGEVADRMFFCISGQMTYSGPSWVNWNTVPEKVEASFGVRDSAARDYTQSQGERSPLVQSGDWVSEPAMWLESWRHVGKLTARISSELLGVYCKKFQELVQHELVDVWQPAQYAKDFADYINKGRIYLHDFWSDFDAVLALSIDAFNQDEENATSKAVSLKVNKKFSQVSKMGHSLSRSSRGRRASLDSVSLRGSGLEKFASRLFARGSGSLSFGSSRLGSGIRAASSNTAKQPGTLYD